MYKDTEGDADLNHILNIAHCHVLDKSYWQSEVRFVLLGRPEAAHQRYEKRDPKRALTLRADWVKCTSTSRTQTWSKVSHGASVQSKDPISSCVDLWSSRGALLSYVFGASGSWSRELNTGLATVEHSLWTAPEDESDFTLRVELVKHVPIGNAE